MHLQLTVARQEENMQPMIADRATSAGSPLIDHPPTSVSRTSHT
jgi:hypothetical protein